MMTLLSPPHRYTSSVTLGQLRTRLLRIVEKWLPNSLELGSSAYSSPSCGQPLDLGPWCGRQAEKRETMLLTFTFHSHPYLDVASGFDACFQHFQRKVFRVLFPMGLLTLILPFPARLKDGATELMGTFEIWPEVVQVILCLLMAKRDTVRC